MSVVGSITRPVYYNKKKNLVNHPFNTVAVPTKDQKRSSYSVKYLGIVDGAMGILSRKFEMQEYARNLNSSVGGASSFNTGLT